MLSLLTSSTGCTAYFWGWGTGAAYSGFEPKFAKKSAADSALIDPRFWTKGFSVTTGWIVFFYWSGFCICLPKNRSTSKLIFLWSIPNSFSKSCVFPIAIAFIASISSLSLTLLIDLAFRSSKVSRSDICRAYCSSLSKLSTNLHRLASAGSTTCVVWVRHLP